MHDIHVNDDVKFPTIFRYIYQSNSHLHASAVSFYISSTYTSHLHSSILSIPIFESPTSHWLLFYFFPISESPTSHLHSSICIISIPYFSFAFIYFIYSLHLICMLLFYLFPTSHLHSSILLVSIPISKPSHLHSSILSIPYSSFAFIYFTRIYSHF